MANNGTNLYPYDGTVKVALTDNFGNADLVRCAVASIPSAVAGYAIGCILKATDTGGIYTNTGTTTSCTFTLLEDAGGTFTLPTTATDTSTTTGTSMALTQNAVTTGAGLTQALNGLTTGFGHSITHTTAVIAAGGSLLNVSSSSVDTSTTTGTLLNLSSTGSLAGWVASITSIVTTGAALEVASTGVYTGAGIHRITGNSATTGVVGLISATGLTTGIAHQIKATAATLTTGRYFSANDAATEVFGIGANGHIHSTVSAAPPTIAVTSQNGITAAAITAGGTDTCGVITTTGTNNNGGTTVLDVTFGKTYTVAPKAVIITPVNTSGAKVATTSLFGTTVSATAATGFTITIPQDAAAGATPSWRYVVIA